MVPVEEKDLVAKTAGGGWTFDTPTALDPLTEKGFDDFSPDIPRVWEALEAALSCAAGICGPETEVFVTIRGGCRADGRMLFCPAEATKRGTSPAARR